MRKHRQPHPLKSGRYSCHIISAEGAQGPQLTLLDRWWICTGRKRFEAAITACKFYALPPVHLGRHSSLSLPPSLPPPLSLSLSLSLSRSLSLSLALSLARSTHNVSHYPRGGGLFGSVGFSHCLKGLRSCGDVEIL